MSDDQKVISMIHIKGLAEAFEKAGFRVTRIAPPTAEELAAADARHQKRVAAFVRARQQAAVAAIELAPMEPTFERKARGEFVQREVIDATAFVDMQVTMLDRLEAVGIITDEQCQGGHDFSSLMRRMQMVPEGRSCVDFTPVGYIEDAAPTYAELRDKRDRAELYLACGTVTWRELRWVCVDQQQPRSLARLRAGLDICVKFWGKQ